MSDPNPPDQPNPEGVRIIGADEAEEAMSRDDVVKRRDPDEPRPGDRPRPVEGDTPAPVMRFPLSSTAGAEPDDGSLPHWTEPPASSPPLFREPSTEAEGEGEGDDWASITSSTPRWRDDNDTAGDWPGEDFRELADENQPMGALDESDRPDPEDFFSFDELAPDPASTSVFGEASAGEPYADFGVDEGYDDDEGDGYYAEPAPAGYAAPGPSTIVVGGGRVTSGPTRSHPPDSGIGGDRDIGQAAAVGVGFLAVAAALFFAGPAFAAALVIAVVTVAAIEGFTAFRAAGYRPAAPVGVAATLCLTFATYHRGESAYAAVLFLTVLTTLLWFLIGAGEGKIVMNAGVTLLGVGWIGFFGSFATLLLSDQGAGLGEGGKGILFGAILCTVGYDVGGYFVGRGYGRSPLSSVSPNKTFEGLLGGCVMAVVVGVVYGSLTQPMGSVSNGLLLGLAAAVAAPLGDLCQSMIKRDLGIKDMGTTLPGHGGFLDRFDALLFVLPAVYFVARLNDFFL